MSESSEVNSLKPKSCNTTLGQSIRSAGNAMKNEIEGDDISGEVNGRERGLEKRSCKRRKI